MIYSNNTEKFIDRFAIGLIGIVIILAALAVTLLMAVIAFIFIYLVLSTFWWIPATLLLIGFGYMIGAYVVE